MNHAESGAFLSRASVDPVERRMHKDMTTATSKGNIDMGFYIRKSVKVGPLRFNLSGSGIGVSAGIPGFRVGTGPRGNYVHMGTGGVYYRATLTSRELPNRVDQAARPLSSQSGMIDIESGSTLSMVDASSVSLLEELNTKLKRISIWPFVMVACVFGAIALSDLSPVLLTAIMAAGVAGTWLVYQRDQLRKTAVLLYDLDQEAVRRYQAFHDAFDELSRCGRVSHIAAQGGVADRKRQAGASSLVRRHVVRLTKRAPSRVRTNIEVPVIPVGLQTLYLLP